MRAYACVCVCGQNNADIFGCLSSWKIVLRMVGFLVVGISVWPIVRRYKLYYTLLQAIIPSYKNILDIHVQGEDTDATEIH